MTLASDLARDWSASGEACLFLLHMLVFLACCVVRLVAVGCAVSFTVEVVAKGAAWLIVRRKAARKAKPSVAPPSVPSSPGPTSWTN